MKKLSSFTILLVCSMIHMMAQIINVPADKTTIQAGIDSASTGDTVLVAEGSYYENINFLGKAITVASGYILDGDTSHISKTIIDGSQFSYKDSASTVMMASDEDTTSVLMGFTIRGGEGSMVDAYWGSEIYRDFAGGGIVIVNAGGKICYNIIEENQLVSDGRADGMTYAGGIYANVNHNHSAIIRKNIIRNNKLIGESCYGGGLLLVGGRIILEDNLIDRNIIYNAGWAFGTAVFWENYHSEGVIHEVIIRNNIITNHTGTTTTPSDYGGTIALLTRIGDERVQFYNNVVSNNYNNCNRGGGFYLGQGLAITFVNNTIWNNEAKIGGNNFLVDANADIVMYNNIIGSDPDHVKSDFAFGAEKIYTMYACYNILKESFNEVDKVTAENNLFADPDFEPGSFFELAKTSPATGGGVDSVLIADTWYHAPSFDLNRNIRPNPVDDHIDLGAIESPYEGSSNTGIESNHMKEPLLYPNPTNAIITIESSFTGDFSIEIVTPNGQVIYRTNINGTSNQIDLSSFHNGVYLITIRSKDFVTTRKIIKM